MRRTLPRDPDLSVLDLSDVVREKLEDLEIHTLRQFFARLQADVGALREHLALPEPDFAALRQQVQSRIQEEFPQDVGPQRHPRVHKHGVAAHRLADLRRPRFHGDSD